MTIEPLTVIVTHRRPEDHQLPPNEPTPAALLSLQGRFIYTAKHNDFLNSSLKRPVRICSLLNHCRSDQSWQVGRHVSDMTAVRLFEDYLTLLTREANREGIT